MARSFKISLFCLQNVNQLFVDQIKGVDLTLLSITSHRNLINLSDLFELTQYLYFIPLTVLQPDV